MIAITRRSNPVYFDLTGGLERCLYEVARKYVGHQVEWKVSLLNLAKRCGTMQRNLRRFKFDPKEIAEADRLSDYQLFLVNDHASPTAKALQAAGMKGVHAGSPDAERGSDHCVSAQAERARCGHRGGSGLTPSPSLAAPLVRCSPGARRQSTQITGTHRLFRSVE